MSSSKMIVAVLGGPSPGIKEAWPFVTSDHDACAFPIAMQCFSQDQVDRIMRLLDGTPEDIAGFFPNHEEFYSIIYGWKVNGLEIRKLQKFNMLIEALRFMIFKGNIPNDESQLTSTGLTCDTKSFVTIRQSSTSQRQRGVPQPAGLQQLAAQFEQLQVTAPDNSSPPIIFTIIDSPPAGILGIDAEKYLFTHGYQVSAIWSVIHAFREGYSSQDFTNYLCTRGMPLLEAEYLFELISGCDVYLCDSVLI
ncbi:hypothetical protein EV424DRAFT_1533453 [Suillus variegatus]|nr:hypothetical protein EV424DRAFT_1533453 [Suillus variegatus]